MNRLALLVAASLISSSARAAVLEVADDTPPNADVTQIVSVIARVTTERGGRFVRHAVVRVDPPESQTYGILAWDTDGR